MEDKKKITDDIKREVQRMEGKTIKQQLKNQIDSQTGDIQQLNMNKKQLEKKIKELTGYIEHLTEKNNNLFKDNYKLTTNRLVEEIVQLKEKIKQRDDEIIILKDEKYNLEEKMKNIENDKNKKFSKQSIVVTGIVAFVLIIIGCLLVVYGKQ